MDNELIALRDRLKHGLHDADDIMQAWIAIDALIMARHEIERLRAVPAVPESAIRAVWWHGVNAGISFEGVDGYEQHAAEVGRLFAEALKRG
jgi:hypothetical protein